MQKKCASCYGKMLEKDGIMYCEECGKDQFGGDTIVGFNSPNYLPLLDQLAEFIDAHFADKSIRIAELASDTEYLFSLLMDKGFENVVPFEPVPYKPSPKHQEDIRFKRWNSALQKEELVSKNSKRKCNDYDLIIAPGLCWAEKEFLELLPKTMKCIFIHCACGLFDKGANKELALALKAGFAKVNPMHGNTWSGNRDVWAINI